MESYFSKKTILLLEVISLNVAKHRQKMVTKSRTTCTYVLIYQFWLVENNIKQRQKIVQGDDPIAS